MVFIYVFNVFFIEFSMLNLNLLKCACLEELLRPTCAHDIEAPCAHPVTVCPSVFIGTASTVVVCHPSSVQASHKIIFPMKQDKLSDQSRDQNMNS